MQWTYYYVSCTGSPYTLGQAQEHIRNTPLGPRIKFVQADPLEHLARSDTRQYTAAVFAQSIWYFSSPSVLSAILSSLATRVARVGIAEYALHATDARAAPHVLATLAQAALECRKSITDSNVRTVLSPPAIRSIAHEAGLTLVEEETIVPPEGMLDGQWESSYVVSARFLEDIEKNIADEREKGVVIAMRDAVIAARELVKKRGDKVQTMDVWVASFVAP